MPEQNRPATPEGPPAPAGSPQGPPAPPAYPGAPEPPPYPEARGAAPPPRYPGEEAAPGYPGEEAPGYPGQENPPPYPYPGEETPPPYPQEAAPPPPAGDPVPPPRPLFPPPCAADAVNAPAHDDLRLQSGRKHLKAHQRGVDGAALSQLVVTVPTALISLAVVSFASALFNPVLGLLLPAVWLLSGPLVFHRSAEAAIARYLLRMRRPTPAEAERLGAVWEEVTRRAGVNQCTYELWVQERAELNATAAAGHIVGVTRHALERLPNSQLAAVLAHELGHHVGGHTWAGMLADWYALPARTVWRLITTGLLLLLGSRNVAGIACGGCLSVTFVWFVYVLTFTESMWWLTLPVAAGPLLVAWLHRRAECRADDYAAGLGFGDELMAVLAEEHRTQTTPPVPPAVPAPYEAYGPPFPPDAPPAPPQPAGAGPAAHPAVRGAHSRFEARLQHLQRNAATRHHPTRQP